MGVVLIIVYRKSGKQGVLFSLKHEYYINHRIKDPPCMKSG